jgi:hypothetical protein
MGQVVSTTQIACSERRHLLLTQISYAWSFVRDCQTLKHDEVEPVELQNRRITIAYANAVLQPASEFEATSPRALRSSDIGQAI